MNRTQISTEYKALRYDMARSRGKGRTGSRTGIRRNTPEAIRNHRIGLVIAAMLLLSLLVILICSINTFGAQEVPRTETVIVMKGECLWQIASRYAEGRDIRDVVGEIRHYNALESADLYPGMILEIPMKG